MSFEQDAETLSREDRLMAGLAYPFWFVVFPLVYMTPDKRRIPFLQFHTYQGFLLGLFGFVGLSVLRAVASFVCKWLILFDVLLYPVLRLSEYTVLGCAIYGCCMAFAGKKAVLPYLSKFVESLVRPKSAE